jgi:hypothetical protein
MRLVYLRSSHVMFALFCHVLVALKKLFVEDLKYCNLGACRPQGDRMYYQDDLVVVLYLRPKLRVLGRHLSIMQIVVGVKSGEIVSQN